MILLEKVLTVLFLIIYCSGRCIPQVVLTPVSTGPFSNDNYATPSAAWEDFDEDGDLDVYICNGENSYENFLYINKGDGTFTEAPNSDLNVLTQRLYSLGATWGDFNNDSWPDLFVTHGNYNSAQQNSLFINNGNGTFKPVTTGNMVTSYAVNQGCAWTDYDKDGWLDLFYVSVTDQFGNAGNGVNSLYKNNSDNTFTQITSGNIVTDVGEWMGCVWGDYNNDGWPDVFVPNKIGNNGLYKNNTDGTFTKITNDIVYTDNLSSRGASWGDYDNDGFLDLFVTTNGYNRLYHNNGGNSFSIVNAGNMTSDNDEFNGSSWGDLDNDGDLDLVVSHQGDFYNSIYYNLGNGSFDGVQLNSSNGFSYGNNIIDYNNDGFLDVLIMDRFGVNTLYQNQGNCNNSIAVKLSSNSNKNKYGIGGKVKIKAIVGGKSVWQIREINTQSGGGYSSMNSSYAYFGLGTSDVIDSLVVQWPYGTTSVYTKVAVNNTITVSEDSIHIRQSISSKPTVALSNDTLGCTSIVLFPKTKPTKGVTFKWQDNSSMPYLIVSAPGKYWVTVKDSCGIASDTAYVIEDTTDLPKVSLIADTFSCQKEVVLSPKTLSPGLTFLWQDGSSVPQYTVSKSGKYWVTISNSCKSISDTVNVYIGNPSIPNIITPNGDGYNENFVIEGLHTPVKLEVFDRWGGSVYNNNQYQNNWNAAGISDGIYYYNLNYVSCTYKGWLEVIR